MRDASHDAGEYVCECHYWNAAEDHHSDKGYDFQLFMVNTDGTGLEQITFESKFNAFPMFSPDGKKLVFSSNRNNGGTRDTNVFIADWVE
jgi:Tol biopolymer transport system component